MSNPSKAKGTRWEKALRDYLTENLDPTTYKPAQVGRFDVGDIHSAGSVIQAKDWRRWEDAIRVGLDGATKQAAEARKWPGWAAVKRARKPVGEGYAVFRISDAVELLRLARIGAEAERLGPRP